MDVTFGGVFIVAVIALVAPLIARALPKLRVPAVALEIVLGIVVGPSALGWVHMDDALTVFGQVGLAFLLFLGGLEIDLHSLHGRVKLIGGSWIFSCGLALTAALAIFSLDHADATLVVAIAISSTSLGLVVPVLREAKETGSTFGQVLLANSSVAEFGSLLLLSIFFSTTGDDPQTQVFLLAIFIVTAAIGAFMLMRVGTQTHLLDTLDDLADSASQMRVRFIMAVLFGFVAIAATLGFEAILGSFTAGVLLRALDVRGRLDEPKLRYKIDAIGFGFLVPFFFITSGIKIDVTALFQNPKHVLLIPALVLAMLVARGVPALMFRGLFDRGRLIATGLLSATNLSFMVIVANVGTELGNLDPPSGAAMVLAGVVSVVVFPPIAVAMLPADETLEADWDERGVA